MVKGYVPGDNSLLESTSRVEAPEATTDSGLKFAVRPGDEPLTLSVTVLVKPFVAVMLNAYEALPPALIVRSSGDAEMVKLGVGGAITGGVPAMVRSSCGRSVGFAA